VKQSDDKILSLLKQAHIQLTAIKMNKNIQRFLLSINKISKSEVGSIFSKLLMEKYKAQSTLIGDVIL